MVKLPWWGAIGYLTTKLGGGGGYNGKDPFISVSGANFTFDPTVLPLHKMISKALARTFLKVA